VLSLCVTSASSVSLWLLFEQFFHHRDTEDTELHREEARSGLAQSPSNTIHLDPDAHGVVDRALPVRVVHGECRDAYGRVRSLPDQSFREHASYIHDYH